jgi:thiol peroxidase
MSFGNAYGTHMKERRLEQRAIFVVDGQGRIRYVEYCPKVTMHPDYEAALAAARQAAVEHAPIT